MSIIPWLEPANLNFPCSDQALSDPNGLLAVGGDLSAERLISAYRQGIFPWYEEGQPILWWSPSPRAVLFPEKIYISRSLKKRIRRNDYQVTCDQAFHQVIQHCAHVPRHEQDGTWITGDMMNAYGQLHAAGVAHSIEVWQGDQLAGGLYGLAIGRIFFGESMFSLRTDASKVAFVYLSRQLEKWGFAVIDCQVSNPHLISLGAEEINRPHFNQLLDANLDTVETVDWLSTWDNPLLA